MTATGFRGWKWVYEGRLGITPFTRQFSLVSKYQSHRTLPGLRRHWLTGVQVPRQPMAPRASPSDEIFLAVYDASDTLLETAMITQVPLNDWPLNFIGIEQPGIRRFEVWTTASVGLVLDAVIFEGPAEEISALVQDVILLDIQSGIATTLDAKLDAALTALDDLNENNDAAAINSLQAFINSVEAQRGKKITDTEADALIAPVQSIIGQINGN